MNLKNICDLTDVVGDYQLTKEIKMSKTQMVLKRFAKGFVAGAISTMILVPAISPADFKQLKVWLMTLLLAGIFGGVNGLMLAINKWAVLKKNK